MFPSPIRHSVGPAKAAAQEAFLEGAGLGLSARMEPLDEEWLVFSEARQAVYGLDRPSAFVWTALEQSQGSGSAAVDALVRQSDLGRAEAGALVASCLESWRALGLLDPACAAPAVPPATPTPQRSSEDFAVRFTAAEVTFGVTCEDSACADALLGLAGHLTRPQSPVELIFRVERLDQGYLVTLPYGRAQPCADVEDVTVTVKNEAFEAVLRRRPDVLGLHCGALLGPAGADLLAGCSGSGKTTIGALLNALGWGLIADDLLVFAPRRARVFGLAFAFGVKSWSWPVLEGPCPGLRDTPAWVRPDGKLVKYLRPLAIAGQDDGVAPRRILFPTHRPGSPLAARSCSRAAAVIELLREGRNFEQRLTLEGFSGLCRMMRTVSPIALDYPDPVLAARWIAGC